MRTNAKRRWLTGTYFLMCLFALPALSWPLELSDPPANAHSTFFGSGWECDRGYAKVERSCVAIRVPNNAFLDYSGDGWDCNRGHQRVGEACTLVNVHANGFLDTSENGWECDRGYLRSGLTCTASDR